jgi:hypothetical protein
VLPLGDRGLRGRLSGRDAKPVTDPRRGLQSYMSLAELLSGNGASDNEPMSQNANVGTLDRFRLAVEAWIYRRPRLYGLLCESHSFLHRIREVLGSQIYSDGVDGGQVFQRCEDGGFRVNSRTLARTQDTLKIAREARISALLDLRLIAQGWEQGAEWGLLHSHRNKERSSQQETSVSDNSNAEFTPKSSANSQT